MDRTSVCGIDNPSSILGESTLSFKIEFSLDVSFMGTTLSNSSRLDSDNVGSREKSCLSIFLSP